MPKNKYKISLKIQQFRKIEWALRNSHGKRKKKLSSWYDRIIKFVLAVWLKRFQNENKNADSFENSFSSFSEGKVRTVLY